MKKKPKKFGGKACTPVTLYFYESPRDQIIKWAIAESGISLAVSAKEKLLELALEKARRYAMLKYGLEKSDFEYMPINTLLNYVMNTVASANVNKPITPIKDKANEEETEVKPSRATAIKPIRGSDDDF